MLETSASMPFTVAPKPALPETQGWPVVGNIPQVLKDTFNFLAQAREQHGDIYRLNLGMMKAVVLRVR